MAYENKNSDGTLSEEASALGTRGKGAAKDGIGAVTGNERLEREGEQENAEGRVRQENNDVFDPSGRTVTPAFGTERNSAVAEPPFRTSPGHNSIADEPSEMGQRMKAAVTDTTGATTTGTNRFEPEREHIQSRVPQTDNDGLDTPGTPRTWDSSWSREHLVTGLYDSPDSARTAYQDLTTRHGYKDNDISVLMTDDTRTRHFGDAQPGMEFKEGTKAAEGAGIGGGIGMGVGAALGAIVAAATAIAIPGLGLVVAGPIAGAIAGAGAGGATGTLLGALIGAGIPETRAVEYERGLKQGGIVLGTRARDEQHASELERDFTTHGARDILR